MKLLSVTLGLLVIVLGGTETYLGWKERRIAQRQWQAGEPYRWTMFSDKGRELGSGRGILKLETHPYLGYRNRPNQQQSEFRINALGFRGGEIALNPTRPRIVLLGGSAAFGTGLSFEGTSWEEVLGREFPQFEFVNAAVIGYRSIQEAIQYYIDVSPLHPTMVIAIDGWNDFINPIEDIPVPPLALTVSPKFHELEGQLAMLQTMQSEPLTERLKILPQLFLRRTFRALSTWKRPAMVATAGDSETQMKRLHRYVTNLSKIQKFARAEGVRFLSVHQPMSAQASKDDDLTPLEKEYAVWGEEADRQLRTLGIRRINLQKLMAQFKNEDFMDAVHLRASGIQQAAKPIAQFIQRTQIAFSAPAHPFLN